MKYRFVLLDGTYIDGDDIHNQPHITNVIQKKHKELPTGEVDTTYNIVVLSDENVAYHVLMDLSEEEMDDYLETTDIELKKVAKALISKCIDCDDFDEDNVPSNYPVSEVDPKLYG